MANISLFPLSIGGIKAPLNLLDSLFSNPLSTSFMKYPLDLSDNPNYGHAITFKAYEYNYQASDTLGGMISGNVPFSIQNLVGIFGTSKIEPVRSETSLPKATISLYLPDTLNTQYTQNYEEVSLLSSLGPLTYIGSFISDIAAYRAGDGMTKSKLANYYEKGAFTEILGNMYKDWGSIAGNVLKQVPNPHLQMLYKGVGLRSFSFEFRFTPSSRREAQSVDDIIKAFSFYSSPNLLGATEHQYLKPPEMFEISFAFTGGNNLSSTISNFFNNIGTNILSSQIMGSLFGSNSVGNNVPQAKIYQIYHPCVLKNVSVDYAPNGWSSYEDGFPVETRLNLEFVETNIVTKENINPSAVNSSGSALTSSVNSSSSNSLLSEATQSIPNLNEWMGGIF